MPKPGQFTGVREWPWGSLVRPRDWMAGGVTGIEFESRNPGGDWRPFLVEKELQYGAVFDTYNCTAFATLNAIEIQEKFLTGAEQNYSDRYVGALDGLTEQGNYITAPPDAIREFGLVDESVWPFPRTDKNFTRAMYLQRPADGVIEAGKGWLKTRGLWYEIVGSDPVSIMRHLEHAPLNPISAVCPGWGTADVVQACGVGNGHEYTIVAYEEGKHWWIYDHYDKDMKKLAWDYQFRTVIKNLLIIKTTMPTFSPAAEKILAERQGKYVLGNPSGRIALVKARELQEAPALPAGAGSAAVAAHRTGLMALMGHVIHDNGGIPDTLYDEIPHRPF